MNILELTGNELLDTGLKKQGITEANPVQENIYKNFMEHKDIIARAQTGTGKTLAYLIPLFQKINTDEHNNQCIIMVPTYELAIQVHKQIELLANNSSMNITSAPIIGNGNINRQIELLKKKPSIVVGTSGRILELIKKKKITAHTVKTIVIDEADKMLDKNNLEATTAVIKCTLKDTQITFFSASMKKGTFDTAKSISKDPVIYTETEKNTVPDNIEHLYVIVPTKRDKINMLRSVCGTLNKRNAMIFINTQYDIDQAYERLVYHHYNVGKICRGLDKNERKNAITGFKSGKLQYLISTDIASRGIHIDGIQTVINVTIPENPMDYLHRAGRCGRNMKSGQCISIITSGELNRLNEFASELKIKFVEKKLSHGQML